MNGEGETRTLQGDNDTTSCISIQMQTLVTLMDTKLNAYTNKNRVNLSDFEKKI